MIYNFISSLFFRTTDKMKMVQSRSKNRAKKKYIVSNKFLLKRFKNYAKVHSELFRPRCIINIGIKIRFNYTRCNVLCLKKIKGKIKLCDKYRKKMRRRSKLKLLIKTFLNSLILQNTVESIPITESSPIIINCDLDSSNIIEIIDSDDEDRQVEILTKDLEDFENGLHNKEICKLNENKVENDSSQINTTNLNHDDNDKCIGTEPEKNIEEKISNTEPTLQPNLLPVPAQNKDNNARKSFFDNILSKIKANTIEDKTESNNKETSLETGELLFENVNDSHDIKKSDAILLSPSKTSQEDEVSSNGSITEFYGFNENELNSNLDDNSHNPKDPSSAFVSEKLDKFMKANSLEDCSNITVPVRKFEYETSVVTSDSELPMQIERPASSSRKFRTVAEKRESLEKRKSVKCLMVESESSIYWEHKRRQKDKNLCNYECVRNILNTKIPFRRGTWKTATWLATEKGRFHYLSIQINSGESVNFHGTKGNLLEKQLNLSNLPVKLPHINCTASCFTLHNYPNITVSKSLNLKTVLSKHSRKRLNDDKNMAVTAKKIKKATVCTKPGPLSSKILDIDKEEMLSGSLNIYQMPKIQLEVWPKRNFEFDKTVKSYLKYVQPSEKITEEWAKFVSSAVVQRNTTKSSKNVEAQQTQKSFIFDIPYEDNQQKILVRKLNENQKFPLKKINYRSEIRSLREPLKFLDEISKNDNRDVIEVSSYLKSMIDSVAISVCERAIVKRDPDIDYARREINIKKVKNVECGADTVQEQVVKEKKTIDKHKNRIV